MKFTQRFSAIAAGVALAAGMLPMSAQADAVAQSILNITNFHFAAGNGSDVRAADQSLVPFLANCNPPTTTAGCNATTTADTFASLNGVTDPGYAVAGGQQSKVGAAGGYVPGSQLLGSPTATYAAATATQLGNALFATADAKTDGVVSLAPTGDGSTQGNVNLNGNFTISLTAATKIEIAFDADSFLRAMQDGGVPWFATGAYSWVMTIRNAAGLEIFRWAPNGSVDTIKGGTEYADDFALTDSISMPVIGDLAFGSKGSFQAETNTLSAGNYFVSIRQTSTADATVLPEPGSLALFGIALAGAAAAGRRRQKK